VAVDGGGVTVLWQAARIKIKINGMIFFMYLSRCHCEEDALPDEAISILAGRLLTALAYGASVGQRAALAMTEYY
jgi:hypothetical protein